MLDMNPVIQPKSDQLNADSLTGGPITVRIASVSIRPGSEQPISVHYEGDGGKPWKPCKGMARALVAAWGPDANEYTGRSVTLYNEPSVTWGGLAVGGIRISHMSHIEREMVFMNTVSKGKKTPMKIKPLAVKAAPIEMSPAEAAHAIQCSDSMAELVSVWKGLASMMKNNPEHAEELTALKDARKAELQEQA